MSNIHKCAVIGCGRVGAACAYSLAVGAVFNELVLIDADRAKAEGEAMDLADSLPFLSPMRIRAGEMRDVSGCGVVIISAGAGQRPGESRLDLLRRNSSVVGGIMRELIVYNTDCIVIMVTNPVDLLTYTAIKISGFPASRVIGSGTVLDTARLKQEVGEHLGVDPRNVHTFVIGEHGDSEFAVWSSANVSGIDLSEFCAICGGCSGMQSMYRLFEEVRDSAYRIIDAKGATSYGIAEAVRRICIAIVRDEHAILTVSALIDGQYGLEGLCLGMPSIVCRGGILRTFEIPLDEYEQKKLRESAKIMTAMLAPR